MQFTHTDHYWQVHFDVTKVIVAVGSDPAVERTLRVQQPG